MAPIWLSQLHRLLETADPPEMTRGHRITQSGDPRRRETVLKPLLIRWLQTRFVDRDPAPFIGKAKVAKGFRLIIADRRKRA